jgi:hypothetical protein
MTDVADKAGEARNRNVLGQKPRTNSEERAAWVRRFNRWARKAAAVLGPDEMRAIVKAGPKLLPTSDE